MTGGHGMVCGLAVVLLTTAPPMERQEVRRAKGSASFSHPRVGTVRLDFTTLAPAANADGITGTFQQSGGAPWRLHRILMDTERGLYYGYDIEISKGDAALQFVAAIRPLSPAVEQEFRQGRWSDFCRDCESPRPVASSSQQFPEPRAVTAGDTLAIDLLADERSGELITDHVTFARPRRAPMPRPLPAPLDLSADAVMIQMAEATLRVNGSPAGALDGAAEGDWAGGSAQGDVLWTEIPGRGRVFLSLVPRAGYQFKKIGVVAGDRISFTIEGDQYEWISTGAIVTAGPVPPFDNVQSWNLWVLHDAGYRAAGGRSHGALGAGFDERARNRLLSSR